MPKNYPTEFIQPPGGHNPKSECVLSSAIKDYIAVSYSHLNPVQSDFVKYLEDDNTNIVISAPTSSGKTLCAELFAARTIKLGKRVLYIAPMKALTDEKYYDWTNISHSLSTNKIDILTGDFQFTEAKKNSLEKADIIFLTPEMFNSKCRYFPNHEWLHNSNIIVDETHLVGSKLRGNKLEVGLVQYFENSQNSRALLLSATIPNVDDFSKFVENNTKRETISIRSSYRPCQLTTNFVPFSDIGPGGIRMSYDQKENARLDEVVKLVNKYKTEPTIIFVGAKEFGRKLSERLKLYSIDHYFHNADLNRENRNKIENNFKNGDFNILIATTTMAWGTNTPSRNVVLSHTAFGLTEMDPSDIHQAIGRAGRLGYSDKGDAYIVVSKKDKEKEEKRLTSGYEIKSTLNDINTMIFHIISYIDNGHIKNANELYIWHEKTLASIQKARYGIEVFSTRSAQNVLDNLETRKMIKKDEEGNYITTEMGQVTARMYMSPLDVSDWFVNFSKLPALNPPTGISSTSVEKLDILVALALGQCFSWSNPGEVYISKAEQRIGTIVEFAQKMINLGKLTWDTLQKNPYIKYSSIFYSLLQGKDIDPGLQSILFGLQQDFPRIISTMHQIDDRYGKYHKKQGLCRGFDWGDDWNRFLYRLKYPGIAEHLWDLVSIDGIGQVFAKKLYDEGIKNKSDFNDSLNHYKVKSAIGEKRAEKIFADLGITSSPKTGNSVVKKSKKKLTEKKIEENKKSEAESLF